MYKLLIGLFILLNIHLLGKENNKYLNDFETYNLIQKKEVKELFNFLHKAIKNKVILAIPFEYKKNIKNENAYSKLVLGIELDNSKVKWKYFKENKIINVYINPNIYEQYVGLFNKDVLTKNDIKTIQILHITNILNEICLNKNSYYYNFINNNLNNEIIFEYIYTKSKEKTFLIFINKNSCLVYKKIFYKVNKKGKR